MTLEAFKKEYFFDKQSTIFSKLIFLIEKLYMPLFILMIAFTAYLCFYNLDVGYVNSFDEARHGINAYEMMQENNYIVNTYGYDNDYWNLKPPISYWCIMLGFKIFGYNIFGLRFYSALAYLLTVLVSGLFVKRYGKLESLIATAFLSANSLAYTAHMTRTGDADALYVMFFTFAILSMLNIKKNHKYLYICGLMFALAFLTKSWHSGMIVVIGGLFLLFSGIIKEIRPKEWIAFILSFTLPIAIWAIFRFTQDGTAFFSEMIAQDLLNRTGSAIEGHDYPTNFYFEYIFKGNYIYFPILIICFCGSLFFDKYFSKQNESFNNMLAFSLWFFIPFIAFSLVKTKLIWYAYPSIIPISIVSGIFVGHFIKSERLLSKTKWAISLITIIIAINGLHDCNTIITSQYGADYQHFIMNSSSRNNEYTGANAYTYSLSDDGSSIENWTQDNMLLAELYGDYKCLDTGLDGFQNDNTSNAILFIRTDYYEALYNNGNLKNTTIIYSEDFNNVSYSIIKKADISNVSASNISIDLTNVTLDIPNVDLDYTFLYLADTHITIPDENSSSEEYQYCLDRYNLFMNSESISSKDTFPKLISYANSTNATALLLGGDIIDCPTSANVNYLRNSLSELSIPYLFALGNHDWTFPWAYFDDYSKENYLPIFSEFTQNNTAINALEYEDLIVIAVDTSRDKIDKNALNTLEKYMQQSKPIIIISHVPLATEYLISETTAIWGKPIVIGENGIKANKNTKKFIDMIYSKNSPVVAILGAHIHFFDNESLNENVTQIVAEPGYEGKGIVLNIK